VHRGVVGAVSEDDDVLGEPDGETGGDDGVGWMGQVISIYPYVPLIVASGTKLIVTHNAKDFKGVEEFGIRSIAPQRILEEIL
jgi:hypothetical protein